MSQAFTELDLSTAGSVLWAQQTDNNAAFRSNFSGASVPTTPAPIAGQRCYQTGGFVHDYNGASWDPAYRAGVRADDNEACVRLGTVDVSLNRYLYVAKRDGTVQSVKLVSDTTTVSTAGNNWGIQVRNVTQAVDLRSAAFSSNGDDFTADVAKDIGLNQNLDIDAGDVLEVQFTETGSATTMAETMALIDVLPR